MSKYEDIIAAITLHPEIRKQGIVLRSAMFTHKDQDAHRSDYRAIYPQRFSNGNVIFWTTLGPARIRTGVVLTPKGPLARGSGRMVTPYRGQDPTRFVEDHVAGFMITCGAAYLKDGFGTEPDCDECPRQLECIEMYAKLLKENGR